MKRNQLEQIVKIVIEEVYNYFPVITNELGMKSDPNLQFQVKREYSGNRKYRYDFNVSGKNYTVEFSEMKKIGDLGNLDTFSKMDMYYDDDDRNSNKTQEVNNFLEENSVWEVSLERGMNDTSDRSKHWQYGLQGDAGHTAIKVYSNMLKVIATFLEKFNPDGIVFIPAEEPQGSVYQKFVDRFLSKYNFEKLTRNPFTNDVLHNEFIFLKKGILSNYL